MIGGINAANGLAESISVRDTMPLAQSNHAYIIIPTYFRGVLISV